MHKELIIGALQDTSIVMTVFDYWFTHYVDETMSMPEIMTRMAVKWNACTPEAQEDHAWDAFLRKLEACEAESNRLPS